MATGTADFAIEAVAWGSTCMSRGGHQRRHADVGRKKVAARGWNDRIELIQGDSVKLPFEGHFDAYTVAFGVRNLKTCKAGCKTCVGC